MEDHALEPATAADVWDEEDAAKIGFFTGGSAASFADALRTRKVGVIRCASGVRRNS